MSIKGLIVAAGYGSRLLPVTRCVPKEMLPVVDRPAIDWVVQEFIDAGIRDILVITSRRKRSLEDWFDRDPELEAVFGREGAEGKLAKIVPPDASVQFVRQQRMQGTGHALMLAREFAGADPMVVAYPDDLFVGSPNASAQLVTEHERTGCSVLGARLVEPSEAHRYGILEVDDRGDDGLRVRRIVEKPEPGTAPSNLASLGRYLFTPDLFPALDAGWRQHSAGEFFQTDALMRLAAANRLVARRLTATRYDTGTLQAYLEANVALALQDPRLGPGLRQRLKVLLDA